MPDTYRTSRDAYLKLLKSGALETDRAQVFAFVVHNQDGTFWHDGQQYSYDGMISSRDVVRFFTDLQRKGFIPDDKAMDTYRRRLSDLVDDGRCYYLERTKIDPSTHNKVHGVRVTPEHIIEARRRDGAEPFRFCLLYTTSSLQLESFRSAKERLNFIGRTLFKASNVDRDSLHFLDITKLGKTTLTRWDPSRLRKVVTQK